MFLGEYGKFDSEWFSRVLWSDESRFQLLQLHADFQRGVFEELVINTIVNASLPQLSMEEEAWEAFSAAGTGELLHCEKSMNALEYKRILQKGLLPTI